MFNSNNPTLQEWLDHTKLLPLVGDGGRIGIADGDTVEPFRRLLWRLSDYRVIGHHRH